MERKKRIFVLMGASGAGKTRLGQFLKSKGMPEIVSHTTRAIRLNDGEKDGVTYYYVSKEEFDKIDKIEFVEYDNHFYCISKSEIETKLALGDTVFVICEKNGMEQIKEKYPEETHVIYISAPSIEELEKRMRARGDSEEKIASRLRNALATKEMENGSIADYIVMNDDLEKAKAQLLSIVMQNSEIKAG